MDGHSTRRSWADRSGSQFLLIWAGLSIGVAFLATAAKFLAPSLSLPVALDVGRQTFRVYNRAELVLLAALIILGVWSKGRRDWYLVLPFPDAVADPSVGPACFRDRGGQHVFALLGPAHDLYRPRSAEGALAANLWAGQSRRTAGNIWRRTGGKKRPQAVLSFTQPQWKG